MRSEVTTALAATRLTRLLLDDELTRPAREWVWRRRGTHDVGYVLTCPACASVWAAGVTLMLPARIRQVLAVALLAEWGTWAGRWALRYTNGR